MKTKQTNNYSRIKRVFVLFLAMSLVFASACTEKIDPAEEDTVKPEADFTYTAAELVVTFVNLSKGADTYAWDFGDGQTSDLEEPPVITYSAEGTYEVNLAVTRSNGQSHELKRQITVRKTPVASFTSSSIGLVATFVNESANSDTYEWNFGDGSPLSTSPAPIHTYAKAGDYTVLLVSTKGALSDNISNDITVIGPIASFTYSIADKEVTFTNTSENAASYVWDFGDGNTSIEESPVHTFAEYGVTTVKLVATADDTATDETTVEFAVAPLPVANFAYAGTALSLTFDNSSTDAATYSWDFGDGNTSTDEDGANTYSAAGTYMVTLTAINAFGLESVSRQWIGVHATDAPYATWKNGSIDGYGDGDLKQSNNDDWEKPDHWTGNDDFRAGGISSDGKKLADGTKTLGLKMKNNNTRGGYQEVAVEIGGSYTVTFDVAGDEVAATNVRMDVYVLNARIFADADVTAGNTYEHVAINDTDLTGKGNFVTKSITFTATTDVATFYMLETANTFDGDSEVWADNITLTKN